jgi:hypothetical protein
MASAGQSFRHTERAPPPAAAGREAAWSRMAECWFEGFDVGEVAASSTQYSSRLDAERLPHNHSDHCRA